MAEGQWKTESMKIKIKSQDICYKKHTKNSKTIKDEYHPPGHGILAE
jgi:hypothetical protein